MDHLGNKNPVNGTVGAGKSDGSVRAWGKGSGKRRSKEERELSGERAGEGISAPGERATTGEVFQHSPIPPFSCAPWHPLINGYNMLGGPKFYNKWSHRKWYWPWCILRSEPEQMSKCMFDKISSDYVEYIEHVADSEVIISGIRYCREVVLGGSQDE